MILTYHILSMEHLIA